MPETEHTPLTELPPVEIPEEMRKVLEQVNNAIERLSLPHYQPGTVDDSSGLALRFVAEEEARLKRRPDDAEGKPQ